MGIQSLLMKEKKLQRYKPIITSSEIPLNPGGVNSPLIEIANESDEKEENRVSDDHLASMGQTIGVQLFKAAESGDSHIFIGQKKPEDTAVDDLNENGESLLYLSAMHGHYPIVHWLIFHGADVNFQFKKDGNSPLHMASIHGHLSVVRRLVTTCRCQKALSNKSGRTAIQEAGSLEKMTILELKKAKK